MNINWMEEVKKREKIFLQDLQTFLRIPSVRNEQTATQEAPLGKEVYEALCYMLKRGEEEGFAVKNVDGLAGHIEMGDGEEIVGILCHVDVVPAGDGWTFDPFGATIVDGKIYARGALDDKGPTIAAFYAMKIVKELELPLSKRVRMIIGTDEESDWQCVERYFQTEQMPTIGFAPDADFPIIYAEKGIADFDLIQQPMNKQVHDDLLLSFQAGQRYNMVPDFAEAILQLTNENDMKERFLTFLRTHALEGEAHGDGDTLTLRLRGVSAHGMEPNNGVNAGIWLAKFLANETLDAQANEFVRFVSQFFYGDTRGKRLGVAHTNEELGDLTINVGVLSYTNERGGKMGLNLRYPVTNDMTRTKEIIEQVAKRHQFVLNNFSNSSPHYVAKDHPLVQTLQRVYEEQMGERASLLAIGGGTYARSLQAGVAFGPLFPNRPDVAHQKDEYMFIDDLLKATAIYAQAIYELAK
ncbi:MULTISPECIES: dipeptidase PepV [Anoxybacillus]|uniref:dipeptidase PepV n=1 Tax=Anoxybacillus TaxID=150247 RepID=UPI00038551A2|nr:MULTISPECIES: dipeptidase PepV [Anoxybacillus]EPZ37731.1 Zinc-dependent metallopeptidase [Anoxybacillus ayderensis]NNU95659.1 dipeptidase PepV [Anoxybacillus sp. EFIL]